MGNLTEKIAELNGNYAALGGECSTGNCWKLSTTMQELEGEMREHIQEVTKAQIMQIIEKLKAEEPLNEQEVEYIKLWICGDADYYVKLENNFNGWTEELDRLMEEIKQEDAQEPDFNTASKLRARLLDGMRVLGDIMFFLKQKERVKNFTESTEEIDPQESALLVRLLEGKIASPNE
ncbi:MAG: hypothetical protein KAR31_11940 [Candidatus Omnitrophica bacterium]|nr:hypothetical protein [Candidatus Omnitrophota bacterium]